MNKKLLLGALVGAGISMLNKRMRQQAPAQGGGASNVPPPDFSRVPPPTSTGASRDSGLDDVFGDRRQAGTAPGGPAAVPGAGRSGDIFGGAIPAGAAAGGAGVLIDIARRVVEQMQQQKAGTGGTTSGGGSLADVLGQIFGRTGGKFGQQGPMSPRGDAGAWQQAGQRGGLFGFAESGAQGEEQADIMLRAMVAAAQADGRIDEGEQRNIAKSLEGRLDSADLDEFKGLLAKPVDMEQVVSRVQDPATALNIYLVSALTVDRDNPREKAYMDQLAEKLGISEEAVQTIDQQMSQMPRAA